MNTPLEILTEQATRLPLEDRLALVQRVLESVQPVSTDVDAAWIAEAEDRMAAYERGDVETYAAPKWCAV